MKKIYLFATVIVTLFMSSCKDVAVIPPADALSDALIFGDSTNTELAMVGVYNSLQSQQFGYNGGGDARGYPFGAAHMEQGEMRGEDLVNTQGFYSVVYLNTQTSSAPNCINQWAGLFELINQANKMESGLSTTKAISKKHAAELIGECRFLRALAYHELALFYCRPYNDAPTTNPGVPLRLVPSEISTISTALLIPRGTVSDVYSRIITDLNYSTANLPKTNSANSITRATKGAAYALKSRVYLHMGNWAKVKETADSVTLLSVYGLNSSPDGAFKSPTTKESIFSVEWSSTDIGSPNGGIASAYLPGSEGGRGLIGISPNLYNATFWPVDDARRTLNTIQDATDKTYYVYKWFDASTNTDWAPIIRYAEVILNEAEALARANGLDPVALGLLNQVRSRSTDPYLLTDFADQTAFIQAILNERRIEFIGEGFRWPDISRLANDPNEALRPLASAGTPGIPGKLLFSSYTKTSYVAGSGTVIAPAVKGIAYPDHRFIYPISQNEIANNPAVIQNQGY